MRSLVNEVSTRRPPLPAILAFLLYWQTVAPDVLPADNGEFQQAAATLSVAHPPGFPLYTVLAHWMTLLPFGTPAYMVNLLSAMSSAATIWLVYAIVRRLTRQTGAAVLAASALATATTFWAQATTANVRSLTAFFAALMLYALLRWQKTVTDANGRPPKERWLALFMLALGAGVTHHASLIFMGTLFGLIVLWIDPSLLRQPKRWKAFLPVLIGLLPLLYLPWRDPALRRWDGFINHALALGFRGDFFYYVQPAIFTPAILWQRIRIMGNVMRFQFSPLLLTGMGLGLGQLLWQKRWKVAAVLGGGFVLHAFITAVYRAPQTVEYMMPAYVLTAVLLGLSVAHHRLRPLLILFLAAAAGQGWNAYPSYAALQKMSDARAYIQPILDDAPPNAVVLADWHWVTPLHYVQEVEGLRPDLTIQFVYPVGEPYGETWARRIGEEIAAGNAVVATHYDEAAFAALPVPEPIGEAALYGQADRHLLPDGFTAVNHIFGHDLHLLGYMLDKTAVEIGQEFILTLAWEREKESPITLFAHLAHDGGLYAQADVPARGQPDGITLTALRLTPRLGALPDAFDLLIGAYGSEPLLNEAGEGQTAVTMINITPMSQPPATQNTLLLPIRDGDRRLVGYDWDNTLETPRLYLHWQVEGGWVTAVHDNLDTITVGQRVFKREREQWYVPFGQGIVWIGDPALPQPPSTLSSHHFLSSRPVLRDLVVSMRLIGYEEDRFHWAWWTLDDSVPAMGAIPTLKWIAGSRVRSPHFTPRSPLAVDGQPIGGALMLYDAFTERPLPILDNRITAQYQWIPLSPK